MFIIIVRKLFFIYTKLYDEKNVVSSSLHDICRAVVYQYVSILYPNFPTAVV
jgi:hypothetical protein